VLGYTHARALVQRYRWRLSQVASRHDLRSRGLLTLLPVTCLLGSATLLHGLGFSTPRLGTSGLATLFLLFAELFGFWLWGAAVAGLVTFKELLVQSLHRWQA